MVWIGGVALCGVLGTWAGVDLLAVAWISEEALSGASWAWTGVSDEVDEHILLLCLAVVWISSIALKGTSWTWAGLLWSHEAESWISLVATGIVQWARTLVIKVHEIILDAVLWVSGVAEIVTLWTWALLDMAVIWVGVHAVEVSGRTWASVFVKVHQDHHWLMVLSLAETTAAVVARTSLENICFF